MTMSRSGTGERRGLLLNEAEGARWWPAMVQSVDGLAFNGCAAELARYSRLNGCRGAPLAASGC